MTCIPGRICTVLSHEAYANRIEGHEDRRSWQTRRTNCDICGVELSTGLLACVGVVHQQVVSRVLLAAAATVVRSAVPVTPLDDELQRHLVQLALLVSQSEGSVLPWARSPCACASCCRTLLLALGAGLLAKQQRSSTRP